ncbi:MAG: hypothetical protein ACUVTB_06175 [Candidatus Bathycorpusculaceae bacterium]
MPVPPEVEEKGELTNGELRGESRKKAKEREKAIHLGRGKEVGVLSVAGAFYVYGRTIIC